MNLQELSTVIDIDVTGSLERFSGYEPMYIKYLKRFLTEPTYASLQDAVAAQNYGDIETAAHTLKGICGNLGLTTLYEGFNEIVQHVRAQENDAALARFESIKSEVEKVCQALAQLD